MMQKLLTIGRATVMAWVYAVTLGFLYAARAFWLIEVPRDGTHASRLGIAAETVLRISPAIVSTASMFALIAIPLAAWSVGSASWSSLRRHIYGFWLVLALFIVVSGNADGLILISGAGLIALWILRNHSISEESLQTQMPLRMAGSWSKIAVFAILVVITCVLLLFLFFGNGTKVYVSEISAIYAIACVCQGHRAFPMNEHGRDSSHAAKP